MPIINLNILTQKMYNEFKDIQTFIYNYSTKVKTNNLDVLECYQYKGLRTWAKKINFIFFWFYDLVKLLNVSFHHGKIYCLTSKLSNIYTVYFYLDNVSNYIIYPLHCLSLYQHLYLLNMTDDFHWIAFLQM